MHAGLQLNEFGPAIKLLINNTTSISSWSSSFSKSSTRRSFNHHDTSTYSVGRSLADGWRVRHTTVSCSGCALLFAVEFVRRWRRRPSASRMRRTNWFGSFESLWCHDSHYIRVLYRPTIHANTTHFFHVVCCTIHTDVSVCSPWILNHECLHHRRWKQKYNKRKLVKLESQWIYLQRDTFCD